MGLDRMKGKPTEIVSFRLQKSELEIIDQIARREDRSRAYIVRKWFLKAMQRETAKPAKASAE